MLQYTEGQRNAAYRLYQALDQEESRVKHTYNGQQNGRRYWRLRTLRERASARWAWICRNVRYD